MDTSRLMQLSSLFGRRHSRRDTIKYGGFGLGAAAVGTGFLRSSAVAQDATPASPDGDHLGLPEGERTYTMFIQTAQAGTWGPKAGEEGVFTLTLTGLPAQTVYFSDRPSRVVGTTSTPDFLQALGFTPDNPPNAALVTSNEGADDILVIELYNPVYTEGADTAGATLVYDARILENFTETGLGRIALGQVDDAIPSAFEGASLFIDDCTDGEVICHAPDGSRHRRSFGCCWAILNCQQCHSLSNVCNDVPGCEDGRCGWDGSRDCMF